MSDFDEPKAERDIVMMHRAAGLGWTAIAELMHIKAEYLRRHYSDLPFNKQKKTIPPPEKPSPSADEEFLQAARATGRRF